MHDPAYSSHRHSSAATCGERANFGAIVGAIAGAVVARRLKGALVGSVVGYVVGKIAGNRECAQAQVADPAAAPTPTDTSSDPYGV